MNKTLLKAAGLFLVCLAIFPIYGALFAVTIAWNFVFLFAGLVLFYLL